MGFAAGLRQTPIYNCILWCFVNGRAVVFSLRKNLHRQACPIDKESLASIVTFFAKVGNMILIPY